MTRRAIPFVAECGAARRARRVSAAMLVAVALAAFAAIPASAANFTVSTTADMADDGECTVDCTLREAIERSDATPGTLDTVTLPASGTAYTVSQGTIFANQPVTVTGAGMTQTRINGQPNAPGNQVIQFTGGPGTTTLQDLTIQGQDDGGGPPILFSASAGDQTNSFFNATRVAITGNTNTGGGAGGLNLTNGFLTMTDSTIAGNTTTSGSGGGILVATSTTRVAIVGSTIANNTTQQAGGGIFVDSMFGCPSEFVIRNSTISGNNAPNQSGGAFQVCGPVKLSYNTITGNTANATAGNGGLVIATPAQTTLKGNIIQGNTPVNCVMSANPVREGFNFDNGNTCRLGTAPNVNANDRPNTSVTLGPLADNGGPTQTHALPSGSAAIDAGGLGGCTVIGGAALGTDQRGTTRPQGPACDSGAFEVLFAPPSNTSPPTIAGTPAVDQSLTCSEGSWSGGTPQTYAFQWRRDGVAISGATNSTYTVTAADAGHSLTCVVTATNSAGSNAAESAAVNVPLPGGTGGGGTGGDGGGTAGGGDGGGTAGGGDGGGTAGSGDGGVTVADVTPPAGTVIGKRSQDVDKLTLTVASSEVCSLSGRASVKLSGVKKPVRSKTATGSVLANGTTKLKFKFSRKPLRRIKRQIAKGKKLKAKVRITCADAASNRTTLNKTVKLKD